MITRLSTLLCLILLIASCRNTKLTGDAEEAPELTLPDGFTYEHLYSPSEAGQGTWVGLTFDDEGRLYAADQHGYIYRMDKPGSTSPADSARRIALEIGEANGLLWAFDALYVVVNDREGLGGHSSGIYRVTDTDEDDELDAIEMLHQFEGAGEHGPHSLILSPDRTALYFIAGNHTDVPEVYTSRHPGAWREDQLLPAMVDPRGHANDRNAPGGWIARMDPDGNAFEIVSSGYRNAYDIAFNEDGELFTFDSDMEWDLGMPWYRPIRVCHVTSASEYGWRTGSGKWPSYYPDNLPSVVDIGQGSPTGVLMGSGSAFPARYQRSLFVFDWSFGTIYTVQLEPRGSSYTGSFEEFLSGVPLPVTDGVWGPDGALYVATGGRQLDSHLYRVSYDGDESIATVDGSSGMSELRHVRRHLERYHTRVDPGALDVVWPYLNHDDRFIQYAARLAVERQPVAGWWRRAVEEEDPTRRLQAIVALARRGEPMHQYVALKALTELPFERLSMPDKLNLLRAYSLVFIRLGEPADHWKATVAASLMPHYPADSYVLNKELSVVLAYMNAEGVVEKTLELLRSAATERMAVPILTEELTARSDQYGEAIENMKENMPSAPEIAYAYALSHVTDGWSLDQRKEYLQWFYDAMARSGGRSYVGFIDQIRRTAIDHIPGGEREALAEYVVEFNQPALDLTRLPQPEGPGENWLQGQVKDFADDYMEETLRNFERGQAMYAAALCEACHTMNGMGGNIGPDLSTIGTRFSRNDLIEALISPSDAISDQYAATVFTLNDQGTVVGRVIQRDENTIEVNQNPYDPSQVTTISQEDVVDESPSPVSIMPAGLLNRLNQDEVLDLLAFLVANGNAEHELFKEEAE